jgi:hypothetical protein
LAARLLSIDFQWTIWNRPVRHRTRTISEDNLKLATRSLLVAAVAAVALAFCGSAGAANVVVGPTLTGFWEPFECGDPVCISYDTTLGGTGTYVTSPISGAVVRFSVVGGETAGTYKLRSLIPAQASPSLALFRRTSATVASLETPGIQSHPTLLPIEAGEGVALAWSQTASVGFLERAGSAYTEWTTEPAEDASAAGQNFPEELAGFSVEVQPAPTVTGLGTTSGPATGGTAVPITGTDFANVTGVSFGGVPAASFGVTSEGALTAVSPARATAGAVSVTVATVAGKANAPQTFTYEAPPVVLPPPPLVRCTVPNLKGKSLNAAKAALEKAKCKLGKVTKSGGATPKSGKVSKQGAKAGAKVAVGTKVDVTLKPPKVAPKKHGKGPHKKHGKSKH